MPLLNSLTCSSAALPSSSSDDSEMRISPSVGHLVPEISIFMEIFNVHPPLVPRVAVADDAAVMLVFHNANNGVKNHGFVANSGVRCLRENVLCFF